MNKLKINRKILFIIPLILVILLISFFCLPIKDGRSLYSNIQYNKKVAAAIEPDNYDKLKISYARITKRITGSKNFDTPSGESVEDGSLLSNNKGHDVSAIDNYIRTMDLLTYNVEVGIDRNENNTIPEENINGGIIKIKMTIPNGPNGYKYFGFCEDAWMLNRKAEGDSITAYYKLPDDKSAVGAVQELTFSFYSGGYMGDISNEYMPEIEIWMEGNENDNSASDIKSKTIKDEEQLVITAGTDLELIILKGGINHKGKINGVSGNYINFGVMVYNEGIAKGKYIPHSPISSKLKIEYYYRNLDTNSGWKKIEEGDPKATNIINGTQLVSYGVACQETLGFWPDSLSNKGYSVNGTCGTGNSGISFTLGTVRATSSMKYNSGELSAELTGNVLSFSNINTTFEGLYSSSTFVLDGFELFVPYYDDGNANYEYQIRLVDNELNFYDNLDEEHNLNPNKESTIKLNTTLNGNISSNFFGDSSVVGETEGIALGNYREFTFTSSITDGNYEGGKDTLVTFDTSAVSVYKYLVNDDSLNCYYRNFGSFQTPSINSNNYKYGVYKNNPNVGLNSDELVNDTNYEDFDWYSTVEEGERHGKITAFYISEPENKGNKLETYCRMYLKADENLETLNKISIAKQKVRYYGDTEKTEVYSLGYNQEYKKSQIENDGTIIDGSPRTIGQTYFVIPYKLSTSGIFSKTQNGFSTNTFDVSENYIGLEFKPTIILKYQFDDSFKSSFKYSIKLDEYTSYKENSANIDPEEVITNSDGTTTLVWSFRNHQVNTPLPSINFEVKMSKYTPNNQTISFNSIISDTENYLIEQEDFGLSAKIVNLAGISVLKEPDSNFIEKNQNIKMRDYIYNISQSNLNNIKTYEILPKNNDDLGSKFSGYYTITIDSLIEGQKLYYTTTNIDNIPFEIDSYGNKNIQNLDLENDSRFIRVNIGDTIPQNATMIASSINEISSLSDGSFSYTIKPNGNSRNDKYVFSMYASSDNLETTIHSENMAIIVADRIITGKVFNDVDNNNIYNSSKDILMSNITLELLDSEMNKITEVTTNSDGVYTFNDLSKGEYFVRFPGEFGYEIIEIGDENQSSKFNSNGLTKKLSHTESLYKAVLSIDNINLGLHKKTAHLRVKYLIVGTENELSAQIDKTVYYTDSYETTEASDISNIYQLVSIDGDPAEGIVNKDNIEVIYYYKLKEATLKVRYVDQNNNDIDPSKNRTESVHWGDPYTTTKLDFPNYRFVEQTGDEPNGTISKDDVIVTYKYELKTSVITVHHYAIGSTTSIAPDQQIHKNYGENYSTSPVDTADLDYEYANEHGGDQTNGTVSDDSYDIIYYYKLKQGKVITHHYLYNGSETTTKLAPDEEKTYNYTSNYETNISDKVAPNYEFYRKTDNYTGIVKSPKVEVSYYYQLKNSNLESNISITGPEEITDKTKNVDYHIKYEASIIEYIGNGTIIITNTLPYEIDVDKSDLNGGTYNKNNKTITWTQSYSDINSYEEENKTKTIMIEKNISLKYLGIVGRDRIMVSNVKGNITLANSSRETTDSTSTNIRISGKILVKYVNQDGIEIIKKEEKTGLVGESYISKAKELEGYILIEKPKSEELEYEEETQEIKYIYKRKTVNIVTKANNGGTIKGDEVVFYGDDSTPDKIVIKAREGYIIESVTVNGEKVDIKPNQQQLVLGQFKEMKEDYFVEVTFKEKIENPNTSTLSIGFITILLVISFVIIIIRKKKIYRI